MKLKKTIRSLSFSACVLLFFAAVQWIVTMCVAIHIGSSLWMIAGLGAMATLCAAGSWNFGQLYYEEKDEGQKSP